MIFSLASHESFSDLEKQLLLVHDHKGNLQCQWKSAAGLEQYSSLIDALWSLQNEPAEINEHIVA
ncbi:hypothetical protein DDE20_17970 [Pararhodobacter oceanensis]|uniref:Uncharacterized protein n=2 Tax=Pararhodobacter oceanensis TaxID=2172121 RepID=A0A2T8HPK7_9RHOB|nr:hypothetical protein DDE20_17970 [Pararhodobacter oceanensis]